MEQSCTPLLPLATLPAQDNLSHQNVTGRGKLFTWEKFTSAVQLLLVRVVCLTALSIILYPTVPAAQLSMPNDYEIAPATS